MRLNENGLEDPVSVRPFGLETQSSEPTEEVKAIVNIEREGSKGKEGG